MFKVLFCIFFAVFLQSNKPYYRRIKAGLQVAKQSFSGIPLPPRVATTNEKVGYYRYGSKIGYPQIPLEKGSMSNIDGLAKLLETEKKHDRTW